ncbi:type IV pilus modification protein PilV [Alcanivorax sp.]|jgi:type IV pilus assembly protein PilV|uniref:type IV pilus modification protein PilV n=1 Tax=Alcanivorax sp. TaxID=1872427 RepID=UPI0032D90205
MKIIRKQQRGVGLIEVMIALLVLAIGVLGYAGMQLTALKTAEDANNRAQATLLGQDALERFLANETAMATYTNVDSWEEESATPGEKPGALNDCITSSCSSDDLATWDITLLEWQAANRLPGGIIAVDECQHAADISCVIISWNDDEPSDCMTNDGVNTDEGTSCVVLEVAR